MLFTEADAINRDNTVCSYTPRLLQAAAVHQDAGCLTHNTSRNGGRDGGGGGGGGGTKQTHARGRRPNQGLSYWLSSFFNWGLLARWGMLVHTEAGAVGRDACSE